MTASSECLDIAKLKNKFSSLEGDGEIFDRILLDAPCSGLGLIRNRVELKYRFNMSDLAGMPGIQRPIINNASKMLKKGGYMLYSTCTINKKENLEIVREFLNGNKDFSPVPLGDRLKAFGRDFNSQDRDCETLQLVPDSEGHEGFFFALMRKN